MSEVQEGLVSLTGHRFHFDGDRVRFPCVSFGHGDSDPHLVHRTARYLVLRFPATTEWRAIGMTMAIQARWILCEYSECQEDFRVVKTIKNLTPGVHWRTAKRLLVEDANRLEGEHEGLQ